MNLEIHNLLSNIRYSLGERGVGYVQHNLKFIFYSKPKQQKSIILIDEIIGLDVDFSIY